LRVVPSSTEEGTTGVVTLLSGSHKCDPGIGLQKAISNGDTIMSIFNLLKKIQQVKKAEQLNAQQIRLLQEKRLKDLLKHVLEKSRFYKRYYQEHGVTIDKVDKITLQEIPPINKKIIMEHYDDFVCDPILKREDLEKFISDPSNRGKKYRNSYQVIHTSGSTGTIGLFVYGADDWDWLRAIVLSRVSKTKVNFLKKTKLAYIGATDGHYAGISLVQGAPSAFMKLLLLSVNSPLHEINQSINEFQPHALSGYASGVYLLAGEQIQGNINIKPQRIMCSADLLTPKMRETIRQAFAIEPINFYAASESVCLAAECDTHRGFHLFDDWHCFEIVDENFRQVSPGEPGKVILTNLYNYTQPLIRYEMADEIILDDESCPCGCPFPVIKNIAGRQEEFLWFEKPDGTKEYIHPIMMVEFFVPGLEKLQIIQSQKNRFLMKVVIHGNKEAVLPAIRHRMAEILAGKRLEDVVSFEVEVVNEIAHDPKTGKYKLIIPFEGSK
jgi:phenylacetate-CoA ligase